MRQSIPLCTLLALLLAGSARAAAPSAADLLQPQPLQKQSIPPAKITRRPDGIFFIDFGRDSFAQLQLDLPAPPPTQKISARLGEALADPSHLNPKPGGSIRFLETTLDPAPAESANPAGITRLRAALTKNDARRMPADVGPVMPFRYVELLNLPPGTTAESLQTSLRQIAVHYAFDDQAADFSCSDPKLNAIWDLCKHSIKATSYASLFVDGDRERKPYEADAYINQLGWYYATSDLSLPRLSSEYLLTHATWPTEWIMFSDLIAWNDYLYSGDAASLQAHYNDLKPKTLRALERADGLISTTQPPVPASVRQAIHLNDTLRDIVDWPEAERDGTQMRPVNTIVNAFHCRALALMAEIADALGKKDDAADFRAASAKSLAAFNAKLFNPATGLYLDGEGATHSSLHANMFPLAFGLVPPERQEKIAAFIQSRGMACSVYGAQFLLDALFNSNRPAYALSLMTAPGDRSWRHMVEDVGTTITLEAWDNKYKPNEDWNHAWGAAPANLLPRYILGVEPLTPGYAQALIWPRTAPVTAAPGTSAANPLTSARGTVPTVRGPIHIAWQRTPDGFHLTVDLPPNTPAQVRLPADWGAAIHLDAKPAAAQAHPTYVSLDLPPGTHELIAGL